MKPTHLMLQNQALFQMLSFTDPAIGKHCKMGKIPAWWSWHRHSASWISSTSELCHMLTVIHEALLAQRGVWQNQCWGEREWGRRWRGVGGYKHWDIFFTYKHWRQQELLWDTAPEAIRGDYYFADTIFWVVPHIRQLISLTWHLPSVSHPWDPQQWWPPHPTPNNTHTYTHILKPTCPHCCLRLVDPLACSLLLHKH